MKTCIRCNIEKSIEDFYRRAANKDGRQGYCKECAKIHYKTWQEQSPERKNRHAEWRKQRVAEVRKLFIQYMKDKCCIDCGNTNIIVLQHDHVSGDKKFGVTEMINRGHSWEAVLQEIAKCEIRCANCHTIVTAQRGNWWILGEVAEGL